jgi:hypothetical protein
MEEFFNVKEELLDNYDENMHFKVLVMHSIGQESYS